MTNSAKHGARIFFTILRAGIGIGLIVYLGVSGAINWSSLLGLVAAWPLTLAAFMVLFADMVVTAWRLCVLLRPRGLHLSLWSSVRLSLIGTFFNSCLPGSASGDVVKIYYATQGNDGRRTEVGTIMLLDRAVGMFALMIFVLAVAPLFPQLVSSSAILRGLLWSAAAVVGIMVGGMLICSSEGVRNSRRLSHIFQRFPLGGYAERVFDTVHAYRQHFGTLLAAIGISLLAHTMSIGVILLVIQATNPSGAAWEMSVLIPIGFLANMLPVTPGGWGHGVTKCLSRRPPYKKKTRKHLTN